MPNFTQVLLLVLFSFAVLVSSQESQETPILPSGLINCGDQILDVSVSYNLTIAPYPISVSSNFTLFLTGNITQDVVSGAYLSIVGKIKTSRVSF